MKKQRPSFPFYHSEYLGSTFVQELRDLEEWAYMRCLIHCGASGSIPSDIRGLSAICKNKPIKQMQKLWDRIKHRFEPHPTEPGRLVNRSMEEKIERNEKFREKQSANSQKRWANGSGEPPKKVSHAASQNDPKLHTKSEPVVSQPACQPPSQNDPSLSLSLSLSKGSSPVDNSNTLNFVRPEEAAGANERERTKFSAELLESLWGPVEGELRRNVEPETFERYYAGCRVIDLTSRHVVLAVPLALIERNGGLEITSQVLTPTCNRAGGLLRDRALKVVPLEQVGEA